MDLTARVRTMTEQIRVGKDIELSIANFHTKDVCHVKADEKIVVNTLSILNDYMKFLDQYITTAYLNSKEVQKYRFKPKLLSYDLYGTIEYYPHILRINNMDSISDFDDIAVLKLFSNGALNFLNEVYLKEEQKVDDNMTQIKEELVE